MAATNDGQVTREEFEQFKRETHETSLKLHAENLALVALIKQAHDVEKSAVAAMAELRDGFMMTVERSMTELLATVVTTIKEHEASSSATPVVIN